MRPEGQQQQFDDLLESIIDALPLEIRRRLEEVPVVVEDRPTDQQLRSLGFEPGQVLLCGLHWGVPLTKRSVQHSGTLPDQIMLFREPIITVARRRRRGGGLRDLEEQIRITLLHEIGHHFGLNEADLAQLGYS